jgi:general stress protein 26
MEGREAVRKRTPPTPATGKLMDSINKNQPEENREDLRSKDAIAKIRELVKKAQNCFFCTNGPTGGSSGARPMNVRKVDEQGNLWFLSAIDSHKNEELGNDPSVRLFFQGSGNSDFLQLNGLATVSKDKAKIKELWEPILRTWFTGGIDDPRITVIKFAPAEGYYWDTKHGSAVAGIKMLVGAMLGKTLDDSVEGRVEV